MARSKREAQAELGRLGIEPIGLTAAQAAAYLGYSENTFRKKVKEGIIPKPMDRTRRWSKPVLDRWAGGQPESHDDIMEVILRGQSQP